MKFKILLMMALSIGMLTCTGLKDKDRQTDMPKGSWAKVDSLNNKGLYKSAWEEVDNIYLAAESKGDVKDQVKAIFHQMQYSQRIEEDSRVKNITRLEAKLARAKEPMKSILHSIVASEYWQYFSNNRYLIYNRSEVSDEATEDIKLWSPSNFLEKIHTHYSQSIENSESLKNVLLKDIDREFFQKNENAKDDIFKYRLSLYDFLSQRALSFYSNTEAGITRPHDYFNINDSQYFKPASDFVKININSLDSTSFDLKSLKLYQSILAYYKSENAIDAYIDADIQRLKWVAMKYTDKDKTRLKRDAFSDILSSNYKSDMMAEVKYELAQILSEEASQYDVKSNDEDNRWKYKEAIEICNDIINDYPDTRGSDLSKQLIKNINTESLSIQAESVLIPNTNSLVRIDYRNIDKIYCKIVKTKWRANNYYNYEEEINRLYKKDAVKEWTIDLKASEDHHSHSTEVIIAELPAEHYSMLISSTPDFKSYVTTASKTDFWVSHIAIDEQNDRGESKFKVTNRLNGEALKDAKIEQYQMKGGRREDTWRLKETYDCDKSGEFSTINYEGYGNYYLKVTWKNETMIVPYYSNGRYDNENRESHETHFFIDRGIYRPGQTIHFKAIVLHRSNKDVEIANNYPVEITLRDVNYQEVSKITLSTNEFGTVQGSFSIPNNGLTGSMTLQCPSGSKSFRVEEYKRPKFEVKIDPVKGSYKLGETIKIDGNAIAYSGASIQDAKVKYTVYRKPVIRWFNWWYRCYIPPYIYGENVKIVDGEITTDSQGKYSFEFDAKDGGDSEQEWFNYYNYAIEVTITDVNGETHTSSSSVGVGKKALILDTDITEYFDIAKQKAKYKVISTNLGGQDLNSRGKLGLYRLSGPDMVKVDRLWDPTDQLNYDRKELDNKVTLMSYPGDNDKSKWKKTLVSEINFDTEQSSEIPSSFFDKLKDGEYILTLESNDIYGTEVKAEKYFKAYSTKRRDSFSYDLFEVIDTKKSYLPGEKLNLILNTSLDDIKLKIEVEHDRAIVKQEYMLLTKGKKTFNLPIKSEYQGGFTVHISGYKNNRSFNKSVLINVPRIDKQLDVSLETFRDKMLPGSKEEWKLIVKASNGEKVMSEVLLNMYDASLDQFVVNSRYFSPFRNEYARLQWRSKTSGLSNSSSYNLKNSFVKIRQHYYPSLNTYVYNNYGIYGMSNYGDNRLDAVMVRGGRTKMRKSYAAPEQSMMDMSISEPMSEAVEMDMEETANNISVDKPMPKDGGSEQSEAVLSPRTNFNETAFFYPDLKTDIEGNLIFSFTMPESLTSWKFQAFAHSKELQFGMLENEMITQKDLMVVPNMPRFLREGDRIMLSSKIVNLSEKALKGKAKIELFDAFTMEDITSKIISGSSESAINLPAKGQELLSWDLVIPEDLQAVTWRVSAVTDTHSDAEENSLPVLSNRSLVTETMPFALTNKKEINLTFDKFKNNTSSSMSPHSLTLEYTGNPVWYAVQAMPYMLEYPHDCSEQIFTRYYANALSTHIMKEKPQIRRVIDNWTKYSPESFLSKLEKNQELKSIVLEESPWVLQSKDETERKKRVALLLDLNKMSSERTRASMQLKNAQDNSGAWPWFKGMRPSLYITQYIVSGFGHIDKLGVEILQQEESMLMKGLDYMDKEHLRRYRKMKKHVTNMEDNHTGSFEIQYLYARSFFPNQNFRSDREAYKYYSKQVKKYWTTYNTYLKGMVALVMYRQGDVDTARDILKSLLETSISSEELGMYWKADTYSWNWYEPSTEKHALLIEAFSEINQDQATVNSLKTWLIMNKRTNDWKTTRATAEACYALLLQGDDWTESSSYQIKIGKTTIKSSDPKLVKEPGTGYFKKVWKGDEIDQSMAEINISKEGESPAWGAVYFQYFEDLDKIESSKGPLKINKKIYLVSESKNGELLLPIDEELISVGDRIRVRLEVSTDRNMSYVHIKDQRAASLEPIDVLSGYHYSGGLGYYQSTRDAASHFFIDNLRKGTYTIEYDMFMSHAGELSNGIALIECMYAPEFASHTSGVRLKVEE